MGKKRKKIVDEPDDPSLVQDEALPRYTQLYPRVKGGAFELKNTIGEISPQGYENSSTLVNPNTIDPTALPFSTETTSPTQDSNIYSHVVNSRNHLSSPDINPEQLPTIQPPHYEDPHMMLASQRIQENGFWVSGAMGLNPFFKHTGHTVIPPGYKVCRTAKGQPFLIKEDDEKAEEEHAKARERLSIFAKWDEIEEHYGLGIRLYFDFAKSLVVVNAILMLLQSGNFFAYIGYDLDMILSEFSNLSFGILTEILYASNYSSKLVWIWRGTNIAAILFTFLYGPFYWLKTHWSFRKRELFDHEEDFANEEADVIEENLAIGRINRVWRFAGSYSIFLSLLLVQLVVVAGLTFLQNFTAIYKVIGVATSGKDVISSNQLILTPISFGISAIIGVTNYLWGLLCSKLTRFEKHRTWSTFRAHNTFKLLFFKLISVFIMGFAKGFFATPCILTVLGNQYLIQILLDLVVFNGIEIFLPLILFKLKRKGDKSDDEKRPEFDVAEEYLELIYRQYVVYCGMPAFPMMPFVGTIASIVELYLDKIRLLKICKKPPRTTGSIKSVVSFFLLFSALLALLNWGGGSAYSLAGYFWCNHSKSIEACEPCKIFDGVSHTGHIPNALRRWNI